MQPSAAPYRGRFAPSPTGPLHFGSLVAAVGSFLQARRHRGVWLVRVDDLDPAREIPGAAAAIIEMLAVFGMESDAPVLYQSNRLEAYTDALSRLESAGLLFPCGCSRRDLGPRGVYPGTCRAGIPPGRRPRSLRVRAPAAAIGIQDAVRGPFIQHLSRDIGDFVVRRGDGHIAYHLACAVDDAAQGVTQVVRGADLLDSTPRQVCLQRYLDLATPGYAHLPVVLDEQGRKLSKQARALPVERGATRETLRAALAFLGHPPPACTRRATVAAIWDWALDNWELSRVPKRGRRPAGTLHRDEAESPGMRSEHYG